MNIFVFSGRKFQCIRVHSNSSVWFLRLWTEMNYYSVKAVCGCNCVLITCVHSMDFCNLMLSVRL